MPAPPGALRCDLPIGERLHPLRDLKQVAALTRLCREWQPGVVHAHGYKAAMLAAVAGVGPLVVTFHNLWPNGAGALARAGIRWTVRASACVIGVSRAVLESTVAVAGSLPNPEVLPNSIDPTFFAALPPRAEARALVGLPANGPVVGFAGRLTPVKGPQVLLAAAPLLTHEVAGVAIALAGEGPQRGLLEAAAASLGGTARVRFLGPLADVRPLLAAADAWAIPSLAEGGGIVALEAMAAGVPLVASAVGGLLESVHPECSGLLVQPGDAAALAAGLTRVLLEPELARRLAEGGREVVRGWPGPEATAARLAALYRSVARTGRG